MKTNAALFLLLAIAFSCCLAGAQETANTPPSRHMTLQDAVQLAPEHNHDIRIASYTGEEKQHAKEIAKSSYLPSYETTAAFCHLTDTQLIEINAGSLGVAGGAGPQMSTRSFLFPAWMRYLGVFRLDLRFHASLQRFRRHLTPNKSLQIISLIRIPS